MNVDWTTFKSFVSSRQLTMQYIDAMNTYWLKAFDGPFIVDCILYKDGNTDTIDFENNFKANANARINQTDSDGATFTRAKQAPTGWTYQMRGLEVTTCTASSLINLDANNNALTDCTLKFYDATGTLLANDQTILDASCVKTVVDFEPAYDYYIIGGIAKVLSQPTTNLRISVIAVPDIPAPNGNKVMIQNVNLKFVTPSDKIDADGRASKQLTFNSTYHSNKLRFVMYHRPGEHTELAFFVESYKM